ncbi:protein NDR1-like [Populus nigra]|uniref:protein NDR1-like n=1 Tax=Populus nigra TaxID=3691 RepID=UPI002B278476|nr:protein NDR1-like [Populus nigra]
MPDTGGGGCCRCCCSFIFTLGLTSLFMWLSLRTSSPDCLLRKFYIPLNQTSNLTTLEFELRFKNTNKDKGVYYDPINVTFFDSPNRSHFIGNFTIPKFYQGHKKKATKNFTIPNIDRKVVVQAIPAGNGSTTTSFRVDLATSVRYKILMFKTKRDKIRVGLNFDVNGTVIKVNPKDLKLKSNANKIRSYYGQMGVFLFNFLVLGLLGFW